MKTWYEKTDEKTYTKADWKGSFSICVPVGALIDEEIYTYFLEVLPPINWKGGYFQCSEPYSMSKGNDGEYRNTYETFNRIGKEYRYLGHCFSDERIHRN